MENEQILLRDGEELLWQGRPPTGIIFRTYDLFFVPFSILWTSFAIFWTLIVYLELAPQVFASGTFAPEAIPFLVIGPVFVAFGLSFTIGRFFLTAIGAPRRVTPSPARGQSFKKETAAPRSTQCRSQPI